MIVKGNNTIVSVGGLSSAEEQRIMDFLQGAVYYYCNNNKGAWFSARDIMGGFNRDDWANTPLGVLYAKHIEDGKSPDDAWDMAGKDEGRILKKVIQADKRSFETIEDAQIRKYKWV